MYSVWVLSRWHQTPYTCIYLYYMTLWWWPTMPVHAVYNISAIHRTSTRLKIVSFLYLRVYYNQTGDLFFNRIFNSNRLWGNILCIQPNGMRCYTIIDTISVYSKKKKICLFIVRYQNLWNSLFSISLIISAFLDCLKN